jgi:hypothetical protein
MVIHGQQAEEVVLAPGDRLAGQLADGADLELLQVAPVVGAEASRPPGR